MTSGTRVALPAALLGLLAPALAGCGELAPGAPSYDDRLSVLETVDDVDPEQVALPDGSELVVGYVGDGEYAAQWKDPEGDGWTAPQTVVDGGDLTPGGVALAAEGTTAVLRFSWYPADDDEREEYERVDAALCLAATCWPQEGGGTPQLAEDGGYVVAVRPADTLDVDPTGPAPPYEVATWVADGETWAEATVEGPPLDGVLAFTRPELVLLDDGRLATVSAVEEEGECAYELWAGEPRSTELEPVARTDTVGAEGCTIQEVTADGDTVRFTSQEADQEIAFTRTEDGWTDDLSQEALLGIDGDDGRTGISMVVWDLEDGATTAVGSLDGRRIVAQYRAPGESAWSRPETVARAEAGQRCRWAVTTSAQDSADVVSVVGCWPEDSEFANPDDAQDDGPPPTTGFALGSADGREWVTEPLDRPAYDVGVQTRPSVLVARGGERSLVWRAGAESFEEVRLPLPNPTVDGLGVIGDEVFRVTGNPDPDRQCRPRWDVAPLDATAWSYGGPILPIRDVARELGDCPGEVLDVAEDPFAEVRPGRRVDVSAYIQQASTSISGQLVREDGTWRLR